MTEHEDALQQPMSDERPFVLLMHATNELIAGGFHLYPDGRDAIILVIRALAALLQLGDLNRLDREELQAFVTYAAARIDFDLAP